MWRRFAFWCASPPLPLSLRNELTPPLLRACRDRHALDPPRDLLRQNWLCSTPGTGGAAGSPVLFFGGDDGSVAVLDAQRLRPVAGWRAHDARVTHMTHTHKVRRRRAPRLSSAPRRR